MKQEQKEDEALLRAYSIRSHIFSTENHDEIRQLMLQAAASLQRNPLGKYRFFLTNEMDSITTNIRLRQRNFCAKHFTIQSSYFHWEDTEVV